MSGVRTFDLDDLDLDLLDVVASSSLTISVCIPCRNEAATIGPLVAAIRSELIDRDRVVDELIVLDDRSTDDTAVAAVDAGAHVVPISEVHDAHGVGRGKGNALWATMQVSHGDLVVWIDGDLTSFEPDWILRLAAPLVIDPDVGLVKGSSHRPTTFGGGGRTTELVARPLLSRYFPELVGLAQPLSGEYAGRRTVLEAIPFAQGWGVEIAMVIDVADRWGAETIAQVELGTRLHRHRELEALAVQAAEVLATMLDRAGTKPHPESAADGLTRVDGSVVSLNLDERPPIRSAD